MGDDGVCSEPKSWSFRDRGVVVRKSERSGPVVDNGAFWSIAGGSWPPVNGTTHVGGGGAASLDNVVMLLIK